MISWANDDELFEIMKTELYTAVVGDILDTMHYYHQFLPQKIQPMSENMIVAGRAMPVAECDIDNLTDEMKNSPLFNQPFGLMLDALDDLKKNEVYICSGASPDYALVGEIMCTRMKHLGSAGAVVNGFHRDTKGILAIHFPCFSYGRYSQDQAPRGKVVAYRVPIEIDGVKIDIPVQASTERLVEMTVSNMEWGGIIEADVLTPKQAFQKQKLRVRLFYRHLIAF